MIGLLSSGVDIASELVARTASTARVQGILQLSLAPVFLLAAIGAVLNVMNGRLIWIVERVDWLENERNPKPSDRQIHELPALRKRLRYAHFAIYLSTAAALLICLVVALMFVSAFVRPALGTFVAVAWILAMLFVSGALLLFLVETRLAITSVRGTRRWPRLARLRGRNRDT